MTLGYICTWSQLLYLWSLFWTTKTTNQEKEIQNSMLWINIIYLFVQQWNCFRCIWNFLPSPKFFNLLRIEIGIIKVYTTTKIFEYFCLLHINHLQPPSVQPSTNFQNVETFSENCTSIVYIYYYFFFD